jgi:hypothetical protein
MESLGLEHTDDLVRELTRRLAPAGVAGRFEIEHDRDQQPLFVWNHDRFSMSDLSRFDPPELLEAQL